MGPVLAAALAVLATLLAMARCRPPHRASATIVVTSRGDSPREGTASAGPARRWRATAACGAGLASTLVLPGALALPAALLVGALVWRRSASWESADERRRREALRADVPHVVDLLASCLAVGAAPTEALARIVPLLDDPIRGELDVWVARLRWGTDAVVVWSGLAQHPELGRLGAALRRSAESGAPVVEGLDRLSADLRDQRRAEVEARVRQIEVRTAIPLGLCLLPAFLLLGVVPLVAGSALRLLAG